MADLGVDLRFGEEVLGPREHVLQAGADVDQFEDGHLRRRRPLPPRGDGVGERTGVADGAQDLGQPARVTGGGDLLHHDPQLTAGGLDARRGALVVDGDRLDEQPGPLGRLGRPQLGAGDAPHDRRLLPVRQLTGLLNLGDGAHAGVTTVDDGDEDDPAFARAGGGHGGGRLGLVESDGDDGAREDHAVGDGKKGQGLGG